MKKHKDIYVNRIKDKDKMCTTIPIFKYEALTINLEENLGIFKNSKVFHYPYYFFEDI